MNKSDKSFGEMVVEDIILDSEASEHSIEIFPKEEEELSNSFEEVDCCFDISDNVVFGRCQDNEEKTVGPVKLKCQARLIKVNVMLKNVCRGRKIAIGVLVCEGKKTRGFKGTEVEIPGKPGSGCTNIKITNFCFILPERNICDKKKVDIKVIAHYADLNPLFNCVC